MSWELLPLVTQLNPEPTLKQHHRSGVCRADRSVLKNGIESVRTALHNADWEEEEIQPINLYPKI